jgi:hypothetical protein
MVTTQNNTMITDVRMVEVMSGVEYAETLQKAIKRVTDIAGTEKNLFENRIRSLEHDLTDI